MLDTKEHGSQKVGTVLGVQNYRKVEFSCKGGSRHKAQYYEESSILHRNALAAYLRV